MTENMQVTPEQMLQQMEQQRLALQQEVQAMRNTVAALLEALPALIRETLDKDQPQPTAAPVTTPQQANTHWATKKLPASLVDPSTLPSTDKAMRTWLKDAVSTISKWFSLPGRHLPMETVYRTIYNRYSEATKFNVWANYERYQRLVGNRTSILDMLADLGRLDGVCAVTHMLFGKQQPFEMSFDFNDNRTINFTPVGRKAGMKYSWNRSRPVKQAKPQFDTSKIIPTLEALRDDSMLDKLTTNSPVAAQLREIAEQLRQDLTAKTDQDAWFASHK